VATFPIAGNFLEAARPLLNAPSRQDIADALRRDWPPERVASLLSSSHGGLVHAAVTCLGIIGTPGQNRAVAALLRHSDDAIATAAEQALWRIWMRAGSPWGRDQLRQATDLIAVDALQDASAVLEILIAGEPGFAEPHHQRGLVAALLDDYTTAVRSYRQALRLNPFHFAAAQGAGQVLLEREELRGALEYFTLAATIHPRLEHVHELIDGLKQALGELRGQS
jgi:tetratricopeptide (TPR) repeat protein